MGVEPEMSDSKTTAFTAEEVRISNIQVWDRAIAAAISAIHRCGSLDDNGYICEKSVAIKAVKEVTHGN